MIVQRICFLDKTRFGINFKIDDIKCEFEKNNKKENKLDNELDTFKKVK